MNVRRWTPVSGLDGQPGWVGRDADTGAILARYGDTIVGEHAHFADAETAVRDAHKRWVARQRAIESDYAHHGTRHRASGERRPRTRRAATKWQRIGGMYVCAECGIVIDKRVGPRPWNWATESGESGTSKTLADAKRESLRRVG